VIGHDGMLTISDQTLIPIWQVFDAYFSSHDVNIRHTFSTMRCIAPYFWLLNSPKARFTCFWFDRSKLNKSALAQS
jgi:hypothetical protein